MTIDCRVGFQHIPTAKQTNFIHSLGAVAQRTGDETARAIPLCLPNNYQWDSKARHCVKTDEVRSSLYVVEEALEELRKVKGIGLCFVMRNRENFCVVDIQFRCTVVTRNYEINDGQCHVDDFHNCVLARPGLVNMNEMNLVPV